MLHVISISLAAAAPRDWSSFTFEDFQRTYGERDEARRQIFHDNHAFVLRQNKAFLNNESTWFAAINKFSDLTYTEFSSKFKGLKPHHHESATAGFEASAAKTPFRKDWREATPSIITPVKDQGGCGSCWAFASTATIESYYAMSTDELAILAPQTLVNCAPNKDDCGGTGGCEGSIPELALNYTKSKGIALEVDMPYKAHDEKCTPYKATATLDGYVKLPANSAEALESTLATIGPVAVNVAANWQHYSGGVFSGGCTADSCTLDHVVVATGYQKDLPFGVGGGYWLIRNSWGPDWGEEGYIRLSRKFDQTTFVDTRPASGVACKPFPKTQNVTGESGVLLDMSYPTGVGKA